ncbi:MAG: hypothetical protein ABJF23_14705 [Bryobacteraceae bacterium]
MLGRMIPAGAPGLVQAFKSNTHEMAPMFRYLLKPVALLAYVLSVWRLGADLGWTGQFFISHGLLSHWQVWLAFAIATQLTAQQLAPKAAEHDDIILR